MSQYSFSFSIPNPIRYGPRLGSITLRRGPPGTPTTINIATPGLLAGTSRGAVPHLSRDNVRITDAIRWVNVPFETFLEHTPPVPVLFVQHASEVAAKGESVADSTNVATALHPFHTFLGFDPSQALLSTSARDPNDTREMPANGNFEVCVQSLRGVRRLTPTEWKAYVRLCRPDIVFALSDTPFTDTGGGTYSQKRLTKSIDRSVKWLGELLRPGKVSIPIPPTKKKTKESAPPLMIDAPPSPSVFVHLAGLTSLGARKAFAGFLLDPLEGADATNLAPLTTLDDGVAGYVVDLAPLKLAQNVKPLSAGDSPTLDDTSLSNMLRTSLARLPTSKPRLFTGVQSPHEILRLIAFIGADLFDASFAQRAADVGIALDFAFPVSDLVLEGKKDLGHNLYAPAYRLDFTKMADTLPSCPCACCAPVDPPVRIYHGCDTPDVSGEPERTSPDASRGGVHSRAREPYTRAYVHHLLHTHEMSAHALLAMHNLTVLDRFLAGVREVLTGDEARFIEEVRIFEETYNEGVRLFAEATDQWREVDLARGKGRLAREKEKQDSRGNNQLAN